MTLLSSLRSLAAILLLALSGEAAHSEAALETHPLADQRARFQAAERALLAGKRAQYRRLLGHLTEYPLYPYLLFADLKRRLGGLDEETISAFLSAWADTPLAPRLRNAWLRRLAKARRWQSFVEIYRPVQSSSLRCLYIQALLATGGGERALEDVEALWLAAHSQPKECDPAFAAWRAAGKLTPELVWARIRLAIDAGETSLVKYLERFLPVEERSFAALWRRVRSRPSLVSDHRQFSSAHPLGQEILLWGLARLARRDPEQAVRVWAGLQSDRSFSAAEKALVQSKIGLSFAYELKPQAIRWLGTVSEAHIGPRVAEWRILSAMRGNEWHKALVWIRRLTETERSEERWRYWEARCLTKLGDTEGANSIFGGLAIERSYYGFMAADRLQLPYRFNHQTLEFPDGELEVLESTPGIARARELYRLRRWVDARREWHHATREMTASMLAKTAKLAHQWGWHARAIITVAQSLSFDDLELRFPLPFESKVSTQAKIQGLERAWIYAIARQESAFMPDARSPKGALGLMQIMPGTGRHIAKALNAKQFTTRQLLDPDVSLRFGSSYLRTLLAKLDGNPILATAAYNAGPHRIEHWLPEGRALSADLWIETVPFRETRSYLRRVFAYTVVYQMRLGEEPTRLSDRLPAISARG